MAISVLIADDHPVVLSGLGALIAAHPGFAVVATAGDGEAALEGMRRHAPDIAVLDYHMPNSSGLDVLAQARAQALGTRIVILAAAATDEEIEALVSAGASGVLFKESAPQALMDCLAAVARGEFWLSEPVAAALARQHERVRSWAARSSVLTNRERELVRLVGEGRTNKELAFALRLSEGTVKVHLNNIFRKLGVSTRSELASVSLGQPEPPSGGGAR